MSPKIIQLAPQEPDDSERITLYAVKKISRILEISKRNPDIVSEVIGTLAGLINAVRILSDDARNNRPTGLHTIKGKDDSQ